MKNLEKFKCPECGKIELKVNAITVIAKAITGLEYKINLCPECVHGE